VLCAETPLTLPSGLPVPNLHLQFLGWGLHTPQAASIDNWLLWGTKKLDLAQMG